MRFILLLFIILIKPLWGIHCLDPQDPRWHWMDQQIDEQFAPFKKDGITIKMLDETIQRSPQISFGNELLRFQVIDGKIYGPNQPASARQLLERVSELYILPDLDLILFTQDIIWNDWLLTAPVFVTCKRENDSLYTLHLPIQTTMQWENDFVPSVEAACANSVWETKEAKVFWRGNCSDGLYKDKKLWSRHPRGKLCCLSKIYPQFIDATFSGFHGHLVPEEMRGEFKNFFKLNYATWEEYVHHKYLIDLDGYVAATPACACKLLSNCAVFKQDTPYILWFYRLLKPWIHYVPIKRELDDLVDKIEWARNHDTALKKIAENGRQLAHENLLPEHVYLYCYKALCMYASLQRFQPTIRSKMCSN